MTRPNSDFQPSPYEKIYDGTPGLNLPEGSCCPNSPVGCGQIYRHHAGALLVLAQMKIYYVDPDTGKQVNQSRRGKVRFCQCPEIETPRPRYGE